MVAMVLDTPVLFHPDGDINRFLQKMLDSVNRQMTMIANIDWEQLLTKAATRGSQAPLTIKGLQPALTMKGEGHCTPSLQRRKKGFGQMGPETHSDGQDIGVEVISGMVQRPSFGDGLRADEKIAPWAGL